MSEWERGDEAWEAPDPRMRADRRGTRRRAIVSLSIAAAVAVIALLVAPLLPGIVQFVADRYVIWTEPTPPELAAYADATGMSEEGRTIYLAQTPQFDTPEDLATDCLVDEEIVLGCYTGSDIYIFDVDDDRLAGTNEVTAAHEMLHAAYDRLTGPERDQVDELADAVLQALPADDELRDTLDSYPASQRADELHSRLGTEVEALPVALEQHYRRYFDDRSKVLALEASSTALLEQTQARIDELDAQAAELDASLAVRQPAWEADSSAIDADIVAFNDRASTPGGFATNASFNAAKAALEARIAANEAERLAINAEVDRYNTIVAELNSLGETSNDLYASLDSRTGGDIDG